ncbi:MAG: hypothetical protein JSS32_01240 [Verrucomicrobia bacterium]|nr:hypothetical protein [Verrucomicrobiota bacterium]
MKRLYLITLTSIIALLNSCSRIEQDDSFVAIQIHDRNGLCETISIPDRLEVYKKIDFLSSQPYKKVNRVYKKEGKNHSIVTTYHPNGLIWQYLEAQDMRAFGKYREWFPSGQLKIEANVIGGTADVTLGSQSDWLFDQESQVWDENGHLIAIIPYEKGVLQGRTINFYPNGQIQKETPYQQNLIEGEMVDYFPNGSLREKTSFIKGIKQGLSLGYWSNGQVSWIEDYSDDFLQTGSYFKPDGKEMSSVENGLGFQTFFNEKGSYQQIEIKKGQQEGAVKQFTSKGNLHLVYQTRNGNKHGEEIEYFLPSEIDRESLNPIPKLSIQWDEDQIHGTVKTWYKSGFLQSQKEYVRNKKTGTACCWYKEGGLMLIEEYEDDQLIHGQYFKKNQKDPVSTIVQGNGVATIHDELGIFLRKVIYHKGKPIDPEN